MNDDQLIKINPFVVAFILFQVIFILFAIFTIQGIFSKKPAITQIDISNYSFINLDSQHKPILQGALYDIVSLNNVGNISSRDAKIRNDSVKDVYVKDLDIHFLNFIIDLDDIKQSYRIIYRWTNSYPNDNISSDNPAIALCPSQSELIYGDFDCKDSYADNIEDIIVFDMLHHKTFDSFTIDLVGDFYNGESLSLRISTGSSDKVSQNAAVSEISDYLSSLGFNLEDFDYLVGSFTCCALD